MHLLSANTRSATDLTSLMSADLTYGRNTKSYFCNSGKLLIPLEKAYFNIEKHILSILSIIRLCFVTR